MTKRTLTVFLDAIPVSLDGLVTESFAQWTLVYNIADRLLEFGPTGELTGNLATSWQHISEKRSAWRFDLAPNRRFHDGAPVSAWDVLDSLSRSAATPHLYGADGHSFDASSIHATDDRTLYLSSNSQDPGVLEQLNMNGFAIRRDCSGRAVYSGPYQIMAQEPDQIILEAFAGHPALHADSYKQIRIRKLFSTSEENAGALSAGDTLILSRQGLPFSREHTPEHARMFPFAAGNSHILSLRPGTPHLGWIKYCFHEAMYKSRVLDSITHARPLNSFYPPGYVVHAPETPPPAAAPGGICHLSISVPAEMVCTDVLDKLRQELERFGIRITWLNSGVWKPLDPADPNDKRDGFIASCYLDNQDPVRLAAHYFAGQRRAIWQLPTFVEKILNNAQSTPPGLERDRMVRNFYKAIIRETACIPLFFSPTVAIASGDVDLSHLEFYGNTFKFAKVRQGRALPWNDEAISLNLRMFAHDFRRPFSLIKTAGQVIESAASIDDVRRISERLLPQMSNAMASVDGMIRQLLSMNSTGDDAHCDIVRAINNAIDQARAAWTPQEREIEFDMGGVPVPMVRGESVSVERIFANLIHNALEAAPADARIWVQLPAIIVRENRQYVRIVVGNTGTFIEPHLANRIFETGFSRKGVGRGLGLGIVKTLVDRCDGAITVSSDRERGTEFCVELPVCDTSTNATLRQNLAHELRAPAAPVTRPRPLKLILVEDDPFIREAWEYLWREHLIICYALPGDFLSALAKRQIEPDQDTVVVTDYFFENSDRNGWDVIHAVRQHPGTRVFLASDYPDPALHAAVDAVIGKEPLKPADFP